VKIDSVLRVHLTTAFAPLRGQAPVYPFPRAASLSEALRKTIPTKSKELTTRNVEPVVAQMFATAAVNMWMRAVHSFLISASLTNVSPIWASVTGYYSSHYSVRALAHLLGFFRLFSRGYTVRLQLKAGRYVCSYDPKKGREHQFYWKIVKADQHFGTDPFFAQNKPQDANRQDNSEDPNRQDNLEVAHRDWAQYIDHLPQFPPFKPLEKEALRARIDRISEIPFDAPPIPQADKYPDVNSVQVIAYHRLVRFRAFVDAILGGDNAFWKVYRNPPWAIEFMDFQLTEGQTLHSEFTLQ
jgi:hypothetical protein